VPCDLVAAVLERDGVRARFLVSARNEMAAAALPAMGFQREGDAFVRWFADGPELPRIFENFAAHIDAMVRFKNGDAVAPWERSLKLVAERLTERVEWMLVGSAALAVRGIEVHPRDIDLVVDDAQRTGELLADILVEPVTRMEGWVADWFGRAFDGVLIEWVAGVHGEAPGEVARMDGPGRAWRGESVIWHDYGIFCAPLDLRLGLSEARGLTDEVAAIRRFLAEKGSTGSTREVRPTILDLDEDYVVDAPRRRDDTASWRRLDLDPQTARFLGWTVEEARAKPDSYYDEVALRFSSDWNEGRAYAFTIRSRRTGEPVGSVELRPHGDEAAVSFMVAPELRGQGLAPRALEVVLTWGLRELGLRAVTLICHVENTASRRVAEKSGFKFVSQEAEELRFERELSG
jgi:RimJ/RimL family protein N-acetyltransferase